MDVDPDAAQRPAVGFSPPAGSPIAVELRLHTAILPSQT